MMLRRGRRAAAAAESGSSDDSGAVAPLLTGLTSSDYEASVPSSEAPPDSTSSSFGDSPPSLSRSASNVSSSSSCDESYAFSSPAAPFSSSSSCDASPARLSPAAPDAYYSSSDESFAPPSPGGSDPSSSSCSSGSSSSNDSEPRLSEPDETLVSVRLRGSAWSGEPSVRFELASCLAMNTSLRTLCLEGLRLVRNGANDPVLMSVGQNVGLVSLNLSKNRLGRAGAIILSKSLSQNRSLHILNLSQNRLGDDGATALVGSLRMNSSLTKLLLGHNNISDRGVDALARGISGNATLTVLSLELNSIRSCGVLSLATMLGTNSCLSALDLGCIQDLNAASLSAITNRYLKELSLEGVDLSRGRALAVAESLAINDWLTALDLSHVVLSDAGVKALMKALEKNSFLQTLVLISANILYDQRALYVARALSINSSLLSMSLSDNEIDPVGAKALARGIGANTVLQRLALDNCGFVDSTLRYIPEALCVNTSLTLLDLSYNSNCVTACVKRFVSALEQNTTLTALYLTGTGYDSDRKRSLEAAYRGRSFNSLGALPFSRREGVMQHSLVKAAIVPLRKGCVHGSSRGSKRRVDGKVI